jgi:hypothetical protein
MSWADDEKKERKRKEKERKGKTVWQFRYPSHTPSKDTGSGLEVQSEPITLELPHDHTIRHWFHA